MFHVLHTLHTLFHLIFGCFMLDMTHLLWLWASSIVHENPHMSILVFLKCAKQHCNPTKSNWIFFWLVWFHQQNHYLHKRQRLKSMNLDQCIDKCSFFILPLIYCLHLLDHALGMLCQRQPNMLLTILKYVLDFQIWTWKMLEHHCIKLLFGKKILEREKKWKEFCIIARLLIQLFRTHAKTTFCI